MSVRDGDATAVRNAASVRSMARSVIAMPVYDPLQFFFYTRSLTDDDHDAWSIG